jgi:hypothetical protein
VTSVDSYLLPPPFPIPPGRGRWRLTLHARQFTDTAWSASLITELVQARGRLLTQQLNTPAELTFTLDGRSAAAKLVVELETDVVAWRWDEYSGKDVAYFRGIIDHSEDQLTEDSHVVTWTAHDYLAMMARRFVTSTLNYNEDQDYVAGDLVTRSVNVVSTAGTSFSPGSYLPLAAVRVGQDGSSRPALSGQTRVRQYLGSQQLDTALDDLAHVIGGFDYDCIPGWRYPAGPGNSTMHDIVRIFYPNQGIARSDPVLEYGSGVAQVTRSVASTDYTNFDRVLGNNQSSNPGDPQVYSEKWTSDANNIGVNPIGLWMSAENAADVILNETLDEQALGTLNLNGLLIPTYTVKLRPNLFTDGLFNMGDTMPLIINSGRLNVSDPQRIVGMTFTIGDDGQEDVGVTFGRPLKTLLGLVSAGWADVNALARR